MSKGFSIKEIGKTGGLFFLLSSLTCYMLFRHHSMKDMMNIVLKVNPLYIIIAISAMCLFICCEAINIGRGLKVLGYKATFLHCLKYALIGFFFSSVTPSASGGQPMQIYYMHQDQIDVSDSMLILLVELVSCQFVTVAMAILSFGMQFHLLNETVGEMKYLFYLGFALNTITVLLLLTGIFSRKGILKITNFVVGILEGFHIKAARSFGVRLIEQMERYQSNAVCFKKSKSVIIGILLTTTFQMVALHSIPFWIYRAFGLSTYSFWTIVALQSILYTMVSTLPLPGAVGVSEGGFMILFKTLFPAKIIGPAMLLSRGISFYLFVLISGIGVMVILFIYRNKIYLNEKVCT